MFKLMELPYSYDALEPYIDEQTMRIHHTKHHQSYTNNFNTSIEGIPNIQDLTAEEIIANVNTVIPEVIRPTVINQGGGYVNHNLLFSTIGPENNEPIGEVKDAIINRYESIEDFKTQFELAANTHFGSGWVFLVVDENNNLETVEKNNQDSPLTDGQTPIMGIDVWEHAYYLKYKNKRGEYIENFWNVIDWNAVNERYLDALKEVD